MTPSPGKLNRPCILQLADEDAGLLQVEATENTCGLDLHAVIAAPREEDHDYLYWGRLSLEGWATLAEIYALRHPEAFRRIVAHWQALLDAQAREKV